MRGTPSDDRPALVVFTAVLLGVACANAEAKQQPEPPPPTCWNTLTVLGRTVQCSDGSWEVTQDDGSVWRGRGPIRLGH